MNIKKIIRRTCLIAVESLAVLLVLAVIGGGFLMWRLLSGPMDMEFARGAIENALYDEQSGMHVQMGKIVFAWPKLNEPLLLGLQDAKILSREGSIVASIDEAAIGVHKGQLLLGRVRPTALIISKPSLSLIRHTDGTYDIGVADMKNFGPPKPNKADEVRGDIIEEILQSLSNSGEDKISSSRSSILAYMKSFEIRDAIILMDDRISEIAWILPQTNAMIERDKKALRAEMSVNFTDGATNETFIRPNLRINGEMDLGNRDVGFSVVLERFGMSLIGDKVPELPLLTSPNVVLDADIRGQYDAQNQMLTIIDSYIKADDAKVDIETLLRVSKDAIIGDVFVGIDALDQVAIAPLWPLALAEDNSKKWVVDNLSEGLFYNANATASINISLNDEGQWDVALDQVIAEFEFSGMSIDYRSPLKAVSQASGNGAFDLKNDTLSIDVESAKLVDMDITAGDLQFKDIVKVGGGEADMNIKLNGPFKTVLNYIKDEPISVDMDTDMSRVSGTSDVVVALKFPLSEDIKIEDVLIDISGSLSQLTLPEAVGKLDLTGGPFDVRVKDNTLNVKGTGQLDGQTARVEYTEHLSAAGKAFSSQAVANVTVSPQMREKFGMDLSDFLEGSAAVDVTYTDFGGGRAEAQVAADLTAARLFVKPFKYEKAVGIAGRSTLKAILKDGDLVEIRGLKGSAPELSVDDATIFFKQVNGETALSSGQVAAFAVGKTRGSGAFEIDNSGLVKLNMKGAMLDLRPFLDKEKRDKNTPYDAPSMQISASADIFLTSGDESVQFGKIYADISDKGAFKQLELDAVTGKSRDGGDLYFRLKPNGAGKQVFRLEADNAGATLKAFGLYDDVRGGKLVINGSPIAGGAANDRTLTGKAEMTDFRVVNTPSLAKLLSVLSLPGLLQNLNGNGLVFTKMEADFDWLFGEDGYVFMVREGRTSGNALGLTFDGSMNMALGLMDIRGTVIPLSGVNDLIGNIPLIGDILTGGTGALFAATYTMKGESKNPKVSVNPLSVITPGILRRVLFEQD